MAPHNEYLSFRNQSYRYTRGFGPLPSRAADVSARIEKRRSRVNKNDGVGEPQHQDDDDDDDDGGGEVETPADSSTDVLHNPVPIHTDQVNHGHVKEGGPVNERGHIKHHDPIHHAGSSVQVTGTTSSTVRIFQNNPVTAYLTSPVFSALSASAVRKIKLPVKKSTNKTHVPRPGANSERAKNHILRHVTNRKLRACLWDGKLGTERKKAMGERPILRQGMNSILR